MSKSDFRVQVVGTVIEARKHVKSWERAGARAERASFIGATNEKSVSFVDICERSFPRKKSVYNQALKFRKNVITAEPVSENLEATLEIVDRFRSKGLRLVIADQLRFHPLIVQARKLISEGKIGNGMILRLESFVLDKQLGKFSLQEGILQGVRACEIALDDEIDCVYASKVRTRYSEFFVVLATFSGGSTAHIVGGASSRSGRFGFALNWSGGMLSFNENEILELQGQKLFSNVMGASSSEDTLSGAFSGFLKGGEGANISVVHLSQRVLDSIECSATTGKAVTVSK